MDAWMFWALGAVALFFLIKRGGVPADAKLSPGEVRDALAADKGLQLVDVRTPGEFREGRLAGARNIPLDEIERRLGEISKDKAVIVYCRSGMRSAQALKGLRARGYAAARHLQGGILAWQGAGLPTTR
jgi:rhodanese-related sulfurtransferase